MRPSTENDTAIYIPRLGGCKSGLGKDPTLDPSAPNRLSGHAPRHEFHFSQTLQRQNITNRKLIPDEADCSSPPILQGVKREACQHRSAFRISYRRLSATMHTTTREDFSVFEMVLDASRWHPRRLQLSFSGGHSASLCVGSSSDNCGGCRCFISSLRHISSNKKLFFNLKCRAISVIKSFCAFLPFKPVTSSKTHPDNSNPQ